MTMQVAQAIADQIGRQAFAMMGTKSVTARCDMLTVKIGKNAKRVSGFCVVLTPADTYNLTFWSARGALLSSAVDVHVDSLHGTIATNTGLYLSL